MDSAFANFYTKTFSMLILIIISGTLSFLLYIGSLKYLAATETSILSSIEPLVAAIVSIAWLNESFGAYQLLGGLCIVLSVIFLTMPQKKMKLPFQLNKYKNVKRGRTKLTTSFDVLKELSRFLANTITLTIKIRVWHHEKIGTMLLFSILIAGCTQAQPDLKT